jgi:hypothetical protein
VLHIVILEVMVPKVVDTTTHGAFHVVILQIKVPRVKYSATPTLEASPL